MTLDEQLDYIKRLFTKKVEYVPTRGKEKAIFKYLNNLMKDAEVSNDSAPTGPGSPFNEKFISVKINEKNLFKIFPKSSGIIFDKDQFILIMRMFSTEQSETKEIITKYLVNEFNLPNKISFFWV
jgi:hypothetical protein